MAFHLYFFVAINLALTSTVGAFQLLTLVGRNHQGRNLIPCNAVNGNDAGGIFVTLEKPLGLILEEVQEGEALGVKVTGIRDDGSASKSDYKDRLIGLRLESVMGTPVNNLLFDDVMAAILESPSPVQLVFQTPSETTSEPLPSKFPDGASVSITVLDGGKETVINAKVGENLRRILLENNIEVYKGLKKKLGNWYVRKLVFT